MSWAINPTRENIVSKIEEAIHRANILSQRDGVEMEQHIFEKAEGQDEYFIFIALLMRKIRDCGFRQDGHLAGPSYADIELPVVDPLSEIPGLAKRGPTGSELKRRYEELDLIPDLPLPTLRSGSMITPGGRSTRSEKYKVGFWKTPAFRKKIIAKFDEAIYRYGRPTSKNSMEMEQILFDRSSSKEEYKGLVERVLLHMQEIGTRKDEDMDDPPFSDISDLIPDPMGVYFSKIHYPPHNFDSGIMPRRLLGGG